MRLLRYILLTATLITMLTPAPAAAADTTFKFGGFAKFDAISSYYHNGDVTAMSPMRDFHIPSLIPVGGKIGSTEGVVFIRQSMVRFTTGSWQLSIENPETVVRMIGDGTRMVTESAMVPDAVLRRNFVGDWGTAGITGLARQLHYEDPTSDRSGREFGYGLSTGGIINFGDDDVRLQATAGCGLGGYVGANFIDVAAMDTTGAMTAIDQAAGFIAYRHFWNEYWRSTGAVS